MEFEHSLRDSIKRAGRAIVGSSGIYPLLRARALRRDPVTVLMYHTLGADDEDFDAWTVVRRSSFLQQIDHLRRHYDIVSIDDALLARSHHGSPRPRAVLTFDDGHATLHEHLLPVIEREHLPVTIYVATGHIESGRPYWFDRVMNSLQIRGTLNVTLGSAAPGSWTVGASQGESNWRQIGGVLQALKAVEPRERERLSDVVAVQTDRAFSANFRPLAPLAMDQLCELAASRWVTIGAHTHCHSLLDQLSLEQASKSIVLSRELLTRWTGRRIEHFAYPNGNHNAALVAEVARLGFATAFTTRKGLWDSAVSLHDAPRVPVGRYDDLDKFRLGLLGGVRHREVVRAPHLCTPAGR